jgi:hypothetical protein
VRLAPALLLLAACTSQASQVCPGQPVGRFTFEATLATTTALPAGLDPDPALTDCAAALGYPPSIGPFGATLSSEATGSAGALCPSSGPVLFGTCSGSRWVVAAGSDGAVLAGCGSTCMAREQTVITGDVLPDPSTPAAFQGSLVEQLTPTDGDCSACALPCAARYTLAGTVVPP